MNEEAIRILKLAIEDSKKHISFCFDFKGIEALNIAIKALEQQPSEDCISREEALKIMCDNCPMYNCVCGCSSYRHIEKMSSVTPQRPKGKWKWKDSGGICTCKCSICGFGSWEMEFDYCPNCGADMRGD